MIIRYRYKTEIDKLDPHMSKKKNQSTEHDIAWRTLNTAVKGTRGEKAWSGQSTEEIDGTAGKTKHGRNG